MSSTKSTIFKKGSDTFYTLNGLDNNTTSSTHTKFLNPKLQYTSIEHTKHGGMCGLCVDPIWGEHTFKISTGDQYLSKKWYV